MHDKASYRLTWLAAALSAIANIMKAPPIPPLPEPAHGKPTVMALLCWAGDLDAVEFPTAEAIVEHLRAATAPLAVAQLGMLGGAMVLATAGSLGMAAVAEGIRALQAAAQAGELSPAGMGTRAPEASRNVFRRDPGGAGGVAGSGGGRGAGGAPGPRGRRRAAGRHRQGRLPDPAGRVPGRAGGGRGLP